MQQRILDLEGKLLAAVKPLIKEKGVKEQEIKTKRRGLSVLVGKK